MDKLSMVIDKDDLKTAESRKRIAERLLEYLDEVAATAVAPVQIDIYQAKPDTFYSTSMVAEAFQVSDRMVRKWCEQGKIYALRTPGGSWRIVGSQFADLRKIRAFQATADRIDERFREQPEVDDFER